LCHLEQTFSKAEVKDGEKELLGEVKIEEELVSNEGNNVSEFIKSEFHGKLNNIVECVACGMLKLHSNIY
jgi:hypothetical protein